MRLKAAGLLIALLAAPAFAECRADVEERLDVLADAYDDQLRATRIWSYSWGSLYTAVAAVQLGAMLSMRQDNPARTDLTVGAVAAAVGSLSFWLLPLRFTVPMKRIRGEWNNPDRCALLEKAEAARTRIDGEQRFGKSWVAHAGNVLVNVGLSLLLGLAYHHWEAGLISGLVGVTVGEINLFTQPVHLSRVDEPVPSVQPMSMFTF
ncbi:MAG: hypothetical protein IPJ65_01890 [Archangiaceae bacterium]|nr:hypothetical protein [Archangiaceae bacterium]